MRVLVIGSGAGWSTKDVEEGVVEGLQANGVEVGRYLFDQEIVASGAFLTRWYRRAKQLKLAMQPPTTADIFLHAAQGSLTRALLHDVDWVLLVSAMFMPRPFLEILQRAGLPVAILMTESPYDTEKELRWSAHADLVWTNERSSVEAFRAVQPRSFYLPHALRAGVHRVEADDDESVPTHDVVFVGSCFQERIDLLEAIDWTGIDFGLYGNWHRLSRKSPLRKFVREGVIDNAWAAALYRKARVGLNLYRESMGWDKKAPRIDYAESLNPRAYELAACGCFHLSQHRPEVTETFGGLVPAFKTAQECEALIRQWLPDVEGRAAIASQLPSTVTAHTWMHRGAQMAADLQATLPVALTRVARQVVAKQAAIARKMVAA